MGRGGSRLLRLRLVVFALGLALGVVLLVRGQALVGGLVIAVAVLRTVFVFSYGRVRGRSAMTGSRARSARSARSGSRARSARSARSGSRSGVRSAGEGVQVAGTQPAAGVARLSPAGVTREARGALRAIARVEFELTARAIGINRDRLRRQFADGRSVAEQANAAGVAVDLVIGAVVADASARLDQAVAAGALSSAAADVARERLPVWAERLVTVHRAQLRRRA